MKGYGKRAYLKRITAIAAAIAISLAAVSFYAHAETVTYHDSGDDAAAELREAMRQRQKNVIIGLTGSTDQAGLKEAIGRLVDRALEHTGKPDEGDYLKFQYATYKGQARTTDADGAAAVEIDYLLKYYDDREQEDEVDKAVEAIMEDLQLDGLSEYEKIEAIYDRVCDTIKYEAAEENDHIRRTAYGALVEGKAVCQGYSLALYRLLLEAGIDNRIIFGEYVDPEGAGVAHTWNIVRLYGKYYYMDVTRDDSLDSREYFLRPAGSSFEDDHRADAEYSAKSFTGKYPMAQEEFKWDLQGSACRIVRSLTALEEAVREGTAAE